MWRALIIGCLLLPLFSFGQKVLVLETLRAGELKQVNFYQKDNIRLRSAKGKHAGAIVAIGDSSLLLYNGKRYDTVAIRSIRRVIYNRSNRLTSAFSQSFMLAGVVLIAIDTFNNLINKEDEIVKAPIVMAGASLVSAGLLVKLCERKSRKIGSRHSLRVISLSTY
jgi:hypothetical protein